MRNGMSTGTRWPSPAPGRSALDPPVVSCDSMAQLNPALATTCAAVLLAACSSSPGEGPPNPQFHGAGGKGAGSGLGGEGSGGDAGYGGSAADAGYGGEAGWGGAANGTGSGGAGAGSGSGGVGAGSGVGGSGNGSGAGGSAASGSGASSGTGATSGSGGTGAGGGGQPADLTNTEEIKPFRVALTSSHVYWTSPTENAVRRAPKTGGNSTLVGASQGGAWEIRTDGSHAYWTASTDKAVRRAPVGGGAVQNVATNQAGAKGLWLTSADVLWATGTSVMRVPKGLTSSPAPVATGTGVDLVVSDGTYAYYPSGGALYRKALTGFDTPESLTSVSSPKDLAIGGGYLYYSHAGGISRIPASGAVEPEDLVISSSADKLVLDGGYIYYGTATMLNRISSAGFGYKMLYFTLVQGIAVDSTHVYWSDVFAVDPGAGKIWRAPK